MQEQTATKANSADERFSVAKGALAQDGRKGVDSPRRRGPALNAGQPSFAAVSSQLQFGAIQDIAAGWDGTLWAADDQGCAHLYDPIQDRWSPHGTGIDAVAFAPSLGFGADLVIFFRGAENAGQTDGTLA